MRRLVDALAGSLVTMAVIAVASVFHVGGTVVTLLLVVSALAFAAVFVLLGYRWGRDDGEAAAAFDERIVEAARR